MARAGGRRPIQFAEAYEIDKHDSRAGAITRLARRLSERVPLTGGDLSRGMPVFVPRWVVLFLRIATVLLAGYVLWKFLSN